MRVRWLLHLGSLCLLLLPVPSGAALSNYPVFLQQHVVALTSFVQGTDAAGTYKTVYTPSGTEGAKCYSLRMSTTDDAATHLVTLEFERAGTRYGGTSITTALNAGYDPDVPPQNVLAPAVWPGLAGDSDGNRYFYVASGDSLRATFTTALTAGKVIQLQLTCVEFAAAPGGSGTALTVTEVDGSPTGTFSTLKFSNGSVANNGDGSATITTGSGGGGDFSSNTSASVDGEAVLFSGAGGKTGRRSTLTAPVVKSTSGVLTASVPGTDYVAPGGNVATATALAANGANCPAGQAPLGVNAAGVVEGCFAVGTGGTLTNPMTTEGDAIVGGPGGVPQRVPRAAHWVVNVKLPPYNAVGDGVTNDTAAIQAAIDANLGPVVLPVGSYLITTLTLRPGQALRGSGNNATTTGRGSYLKQADGVNDSALKLLCNVNDGYMHWTVVDNLSISKSATTPDTLGHGVTLVDGGEGYCRTGEGTRITNVTVRDFPQAGFYFPNGSTPLMLDHLNALRNGTYGLDFDTGGTNSIVSLFDLSNISGDSNALGLIHFKTGYFGGPDAIRIRHVKSEGWQSSGPLTPGQTTAIVIEQSQGHFYISDVSHTAFGTGPETVNIVRILGTLHPRLWLENIHCGEGDCHNLVEDQTYGTAIPFDHGHKWVTTYRDSKTQEWETNGMRLHGVSVGNTLAIPTTPGVVRQQGSANNLTLHKINRFVDTAPTGNFADYRDAADTTSLWRVDSTGVLQAGEVPAARVQPSPVFLGGAILQMALTNNGHLEMRASLTPTVASGAADCGTAPVLTGNDIQGRVTVGTTPGSKCTLTFANAWSQAPGCFCQNGSAAQLCRGLNATTTTVELTGTLAAGNVLEFRCGANY